MATVSIFSPCLRYHHTITPYIFFLTERHNWIENHLKIATPISNSYLIAIKMPGVVLYGKKALVPIVLVAVFFMACTPKNLTCRQGIRGHLL